MKTKQYYINETINEILEKLETNNKVLCNRYTGFGKTYNVIPNIITALNSKFIIVVPNLILYDQYNKFYKDSLNVNVITYQTLSRKTMTELKEYNDVKYIICEEAHRLGSNSWLKGIERLEKITNAKVIGFTATPLRGDGNNVLHTYFNNVEIKPITLLDAINFGIAPKVNYIVAYAEQSDEQLNSKLSEIDRYKISKLLNVENIIKKHIPQEKLENNLKILVFVPQLKYINEAKQKCYDWFSKIYSNKNINLYQLSSKECVSENRYQLKMFTENNNINDIDILVSVNKLTEGLHLPEVSIEIMLRKTKSPVTYFQQLGRVINNDVPIVFDLINNSKHLYTMKHQSLNSYSNLTFKDKVVFNDFVNLIDETTEIENILNKYRLMHSEDIIKILNDNKDYIINNPNSLTIRQLAKELGLADRTFRTYINFYNWEIKNLPTIGHFKYIDILNANAELIKNSSNTYTIYELSKLLGVSYGSLSSYASRNNIKFNKNKTKSTNVNDIILKHKLEIEENKENLTRKEWSKRLNVEYKTFNNCLRKMNLNTTSLKTVDNQSKAISIDAYYEIIKNNRNNLETGKLNLLELAKQNKLNETKLSVIAKIEGIKLPKQRKTNIDDYINIIKANYNFINDNINKLDRITLLKALGLNDIKTESNIHSFFRVCNYFGIKNTDNGKMKINTLSNKLLLTYKDYIVENKNKLTRNQIINYILEHENMPYNKRTSIYSALKRLEKDNLI